jgi:outer membrane lipoprotein LolB
MSSIRLAPSRFDNADAASTPRRVGWRRSLRCIAFTSLLTLGACVQMPRTDMDVPATNVWSGRLSLQVRSEPPQSFSGGFEIKGNPSQGELRLNSPLGNTVLAARWSPTQATLYSGNQSRNFVSIDALIEQSTGAALPVAALFDWLDGKDTQSSGWTADLTHQPEGRINASRINPLPQSELRIVLDMPTH